MDHLLASLGARVTAFTHNGLILLSPGAESLIRTVSGAHHLYGCQTHLDQRKGNNLISQIIQTPALGYLPIPACPTKHWQAPDHPHLGNLNRSGPIITKSARRTLQGLGTLPQIVLAPVLARVRHRGLDPRESTSPKHMPMGGSRLLAVFNRTLSVIIYYHLVSSFRFHLRTRLSSTSYGPSFILTLWQVFVILSVHLYHSVVRTSHFICLSSLSIVYAPAI